MGFNTNTTDRLPAITPIGTTFVFDISVLPAPASDVITLLPGNYIISDDVDFGLNSLKFDSVGQNLSIRTIDKKLSTVTSSTIGTFLDIVNAANVDLTDLQINLTGVGAKFCNILGVTGTVTPNSVSIVFSGGGTTEFGLVGSGNFNAARLTATGFRNGVTFQNVVAVEFDNFFWQSDFAGTGSIFTIESVFFTAAFNNGGVVAAPSQSLFNINPTIAPFNNLIIQQVFNNGPSTYFKAGVEFAISNIVDASSSTFTVDAVNDISTLAQYQTSAAHGYAVGERVFHTNFGTASYLGSKVVTAVDSTTLYKTGDVHFIDETGNTIAPKATVTATGHSFILDEPVNISQTINFNDGYLVKDPLTNTFEIELKFLFPGTETNGLATSGSLDQTDPRIDGIENGDEPNSMTIAQANLSSQQTSTITASTSTVSTIVADSANPLHSLVTTTAVHGLAVRRGVEITGTSNTLFDGNTYLVLTVPSTTTFTISETFAAPAVVAGTVTTGIGVSEPVGGTAWIRNPATERFTIEPDGRVFYTANRSFSGSFGYNASVQKVGGGSDIIEGCLFINGKKEETSITVTENATVTTIAKFVLARLEANDFLDIGFANNSATNNILVEAQSEISATRN